MKATELISLEDIQSYKNPTAIGKVKEFTVLPCNRKEITKFIETWHYSKSINGLQTLHCFKLLDKNLNLIGAMLYGNISMKGVWKKYAEDESQIVELKRLCCIDDTPKNTESFFIGKTLKWLKRNTSIKTIISYADSNYNHEGTIYKATNFEYKGLTQKTKVILYNGKKYHDKTLRVKHNGIIKPYAVEIKKALEEGKAEWDERKGKHIFLYNLE